MIDAAVIILTFALGCVWLVAYTHRLQVRRQAELALAIITAINNALIEGMTDKDNA